MLSPLGRVDGGILRDVQQGDLFALGDYQAALATAGAGTVTAAMITAGIIRRTGPGGAFNDTFDTADAILQALAPMQAAGLSVIPAAGVPNSYGPGIKPGVSFNFLYRNTVAFAMTAVAPANGGFVLGTDVNVAASLCRVYKVTINAPYPPSTVGNAATTNTTKVITGMSVAQTNLIQPGMSVYGTGIAASTLVASVQSGVGVTTDTNSTATNNPVAITFTPTVTLLGLFSTTA